MFISTKLIVGVALLLCFIDNIVSDLSTKGNATSVKTLVLLDDWHFIDTHSLFWTQLRSMTYRF